MDMQDKVDESSAQHQALAIETPLIEPTSEKPSEDSNRDASGSTDSASPETTEPPVSATLEDYEVVFIEGSNGVPNSHGLPILVPKGRLESYIEGMVREVMLRYLDIDVPTIEEKTHELYRKVKRNKKRKEKRRAGKDRKANTEEEVKQA